MCGTGVLINDANRTIQSGTPHKIFCVACFDATAVARRNRDSFAPPGIMYIDVQEALEPGQFRLCAECGGWPEARADGGLISHACASCNGEETYLAFITEDGLDPKPPMQCKCERLSQRECNESCLLRMSDGLTDT